jgi:hypothetical protein
MSRFYHADIPIAVILRTARTMTHTMIMTARMNTRLLIVRLAALSVNLSKGGFMKKIYIASSWKNQHAVEMLTVKLREAGHEVISFVERAVNDEGRSSLKFDVEKWIWSDDGLDKFHYDTDGATKSDLVIYIGPSGTDAWAEVGAAWACGVPIWGLWAKGEPAGLMRRMVTWYDDHKILLEALI